MDDNEDTERRFDVELFIVHPTMSPAELTAGLGLEPVIVHPVGVQRRTPNGRLLEGVYRDTRWRHSIRYKVRDQWLAERVTELVDRLIPYQAFLRQIRSTGGTTTIIVQFLGDCYFGDDMPRETLSKLIQLDLDLAVERFAVPQN